MKEYQSKKCTFASIFKKMIMPSNTMSCKNLVFSLLFSFLTVFSFGQEAEKPAIHQDTTAHISSPTEQSKSSVIDGEHNTNEKNEAHEHVDHKFDPAATAFHHISDQNIYNVGPFNIPLPCMLYVKGKGWEVFNSSKFAFDGVGHGDGQ